MGDHRLSAIGCGKQGGDRRRIGTSEHRLGDTSREAGAGEGGQLALALDGSCRRRSPGLAAKRADPAAPGKAAGGGELRIDIGIGIA